MFSFCQTFTFYFFKLVWVNFEWVNQEMTTLYINWNCQTTGFILWQLCIQKEEKNWFSFQNGGQIYFLFLFAVQINELYKLFLKL